MNIEEPGFINFSVGASTRLELLKKLLDAARPKVMVEIGVWKGDLAKRLLEQCEYIERYYMIDPWANLPDWNKPFNVESEIFDNIYAEAMENTAFAADKIVVLRGRTKEVVSQIPDQSLDLAYIDGDHTLRGITLDLFNIFPKVKPDGLIVGDDFVPNPWQHDMQYEPTLVCPYSVYYAEAMELPIIALPFRQFIIQKKLNAKFSFVDHTGKYSDLSLNKLPVKNTTT